MQLLNIILLSILLPALSISGISIQDSGRNYVSESVVSVLGGGIRFTGCRPTVQVQR